MHGVSARERRAAVLKHAAESHAALSTLRYPPAGSQFTILREFTNDCVSASQRYSSVTQKKQVAGTLSGFGLRSDASACTVQVLRREVWEMETASTELVASTEQESLSWVAGEVRSVRVVIVTYPI